MGLYKSSTTHYLVPSYHAIPRRCILLPRQRHSRRPLHRRLGPIRPRRSLQLVQHPQMDHHSTARSVHLDRLLLQLSLRGRDRRYHQRPPHLLQRCYSRYIPLCPGICARVSRLSSPLPNANHPCSPLLFASMGEASQSPHHPFLHSLTYLPRCTVE